MVLLGEIRQCVSMRFDLHAAVLGNGQQEVENLGRLQVFRRIEQQPVDLHAPRLEVPFERARRVRISFARLSASILWVNERSGVRPAEAVAASDSGATGMGGDHTHGFAPFYAPIDNFRPNSAGPRPEL